jgi:hypothetical protein
MCNCQDDFEREVFRVCIDKGQQSRDVEFKNAARECLVTLFDGTGLKRFIAFKRGWSAGRVFGGCAGHRLDYLDSSEPADAPSLQKLIATHA